MPIHSTRQCPLPHCKGDAVLGEFSIGGANMIAVRCLKCGLIGPQFYKESRSADRLALTLWNDREVIKNPDAIKEDELAKLLQNREDVFIKVYTDKSTTLAPGAHYASKEDVVVDEEDDIIIIGRLRT